MSKFLVGDHVRIRYRAEIADPNQDLIYTDAMQKYEGYIATVSYIDEKDGEIGLEIDGRPIPCYWLPEWLEMEGLTYADQWTAAIEAQRPSDPDVLRPQSQCENEARDPEAIMSITRNMCRG